MCKCGNTDYINVCGKTSDCCCITYKDVDTDGYVPDYLGIGGGDYISFKYCPRCGQIQNFQSLTDEEIFESLKNC